jgi:hypothetical protein
MSSLWSDLCGVCVSVVRSLIRPVAHLTIPLCLLALLAPVGCQSTQPTATSRPAYFGPTESLGTVLDRINAKRGNLVTIRATGKWEGNLGPSRDKLTWVNGTFTLQHLKPDMARLFLNKDVASVVFDLGTDGKILWAINKREGVAWWGQSRSLSSPPLESVPISPKLLLDLVGAGLYDSDLLSEPVPTLRFNPDYDVYMISWSAKRNDRWVTVREIWFDRQTLDPKWVFLFDDGGRVVVRGTLSKFVDVVGDAGKPSPGRIAGLVQLFFPDTGSTLQLEVESARERGGIPVSPTPKNFVFDPNRAGVERVINLDEPVAPR